MLSCTVGACFGQRIALSKVMMQPILSMAKLMNVMGGIWRGVHVPVGRCAPVICNRGSI